MAAIANDSVLGHNETVGKIIDRRALDYWFVADRVFRGAREGGGVTVESLMVRPTVSAIGGGGGALGGGASNIFGGAVGGPSGARARAAAMAAAGKALERLRMLCTSGAAPAAVATSRAEVGAALGACGLNERVAQEFRDASRRNQGGNLDGARAGDGPNYKDMQRVLGRLWIGPYMPAQDKPVEFFAEHFSAFLSDRTRYGPRSLIPAECSATFTTGCC